MCQYEQNWCRKQCQTRCQNWGGWIKYFDGYMQQQQVIRDPATAQQRLINMGGWQNMVCRVKY